VVLTGTSWTGCSVNGEVNLVAVVQLSDEVSSEQARQSRRHSASDDNRHAVLSRRLVQLAQRPNVVKVIRGGDHRYAVCQELDRRTNLRATVSKHRNIAICRLSHGSPRVDRDHFATGSDKVESLRNPFTGDAAADEGETCHQFSGSSSGRHPPCCGGVPPVPRTRNAAANAPASRIAEIAPRMNFIP
jgi:hypothetical protein